MVRPYALIGGRTRPTGEALDVIAMIIAVRGSSYDPADLEPEHLHPLPGRALLLSRRRMGATLRLHLERQLRAVFTLGVAVVILASGGVERRSGEARLWSLGSALGTGAVRSCPASGHF